MPGIGTALESACLPRRLFAYSVKVVAEKGRLDIFAKFTRGLVSREWNNADRIALRTLPLAVEPRTGNDKIRVIGIMLRCVAKNLPWTPGIFLIPKAGYVQIRNRGGVKLIDPGFFFPKIIVIGMRNGIVPVGN